MAVSAPIIFPDAEAFEAIRNDLKEDPERLMKQVDIFKEWLRCESHLPTNVDDKLVTTFVRLSKCDLEKAKRKFEKFLAAREKLNDFFSRKIDEKYFAVHSVQRQIITHPKLTPDGYRVTYYRTVENPDDFNYNHIAHYMLLMLDYLFFEDTSAGNIIVHDLKHFTGPHLAKINIKTHTEIVNIVYNISPLRVKSIHLVNLPKIAEVIVAIAKKVVGDKIAKRIFIHKDVRDLAKFLPSYVIPDEYGGCGGDLDKFSEITKKYFLQYDNWIRKSEALKLAGPVPPEKQYLYSFEEFQMKGSFRQLNID